MIFKINKSSGNILVFLVLFICCFSTTVFPKAPRKASTFKSNFKNIANQVLDKDLIYNIYSFKHRRGNTRVHVLEYNLKSKKFKPKLIFAKSYLGNNQKLNELVNVFEQQNNTKVLGAINSSFWSAGNSFPVGITIVDGEVAHFDKYKNWSTMVFDNDNVPFIDTLHLTARLFNSTFDFEINAFNKRKDSNMVVIYNKNYSEVIPKYTNTMIDMEIDRMIESFLNDDFLDETDVMPTLEELQIMAMEKFTLSSKEYAHRKIVLKYLDKPCINKALNCIVTNVSDSGSVNIGTNEFLLSLPKNSLPYIFKVGDKFQFEVNSSHFSDVEIINALSGTPRLNRQGNTKHEASLEGSKGKRFIYSMLPRTAIGYNFDKTKLFLVALEFANSINACTGSNLANLTEIMKLVGCYESINLDGGGSTTMVIDSKNVTKPDNSDKMRKIAKAFAIIKN